ncbi:MAG: helix-turn-helix transcriptional regulator [Clostridia bacterium]|nr:helix-turn-helix transcriptional regulator [Clostridia bacterium]
MVPKSETKQNYDIFHLIIEYMWSNFKDDIHLSDMAKHLGYHEKYLSSAIRSTTGMNFRTFLALYRINYAKNLLLNSRYAISEIATQCGFSSINTFNRMFLKLTKVTPSESKQNNSPAKILQ